jgi:nicotinamidase-related amidase
MTAASPLTLFEVLSASYRDALPVPEPRREDTALLLIDIQELAAPEHFAAAAIEAGMPAAEVHAALADYSERFHAAVANCKKLLVAARAAGIVPIHVKIQAMAGDGRDTGALHRRLGWCFAPGTEGTAFLAATAPAPGEIAITKTASGAFTGTSLDFTLRNMGIEHLYICGFVADECVETTVRQALDLGYRVRLVEDATTTYDRTATEHSVGKFKGYGFTRETAVAVETFAALGKAA